MHDLNDLYYFVQVVEHGGFAPAGRALGEPKSKLSRRIALLEERLGVRLIQRSTRGIDVAIRVRPMPIEDSDLMLKILAQRGHTSNGPSSNEGKRPFVSPCS
jgi:hypothetical protein